MADITGEGPSHRYHRYLLCLPLSITHFLRRDLPRSLGAIPRYTITDQLKSDPADPRQFPTDTEAKAQALGRFKPKAYNWGQASPRKSPYTIAVVRHGFSLIIGPGKPRKKTLSKPRPLTFT